MTETTAKETDLAPSETDAAPGKDPLFSDLFRVSHDLRDAFAPVEPAPRFVARVRDQLDANVENARDVFARHARRRKRLRLTAFGIGGAAYLVGLGIVGVRAGRWLLSRRRKSAAPLPDTEAE